MVTSNAIYVMHYFRTIFEQIASANVYASFLFQHRNKLDVPEGQTKFSTPRKPPSRVTCPVGVETAFSLSQNSLLICPLYD